jgi:excisionase family DNA binding protein
MITSEWMTSLEAAAYLKVPKKTLLAWVRRGQVKAYRLSGTKRYVYRFRKEDLDASMAVTAAYQNAMVESARSSAALV